MLTGFGPVKSYGSERSHVPAQRRRRIASPAAFIDRRIVSATASACAADRYVSCSRIAPAMIRTRSSRVRGGGEPALGIPHGSAIGTKCEQPRSDDHAPAVLQPADRALSLTVNEALTRIRRDRNALRQRVHRWLKHARRAAGCRTRDGTSPRSRPSRGGRTRPRCAI